jgi:uncharacterized protein
MPRPVKCRRVGFEPGVTYYKPRGVPLHDLLEVALGVDELEALRLADTLGLSQEEGAAQMGVSRATFGRILERAHRKVAEALVKGKALKIEGGDYEMNEMRNFACSDCRRQWQVPFGTGRPGECPACHGRNFQRSMACRSQGSGYGQRHGPKKQKGGN